MNASHNHTNDQHQHILLLLPWYINNSLQQDELTRVESHIRNCLLCRRELIGLRKLATSVGRKSALEIAAETSFSQLSNKLSSRFSVAIALPIKPKTRLRFEIGRYMPGNSFRYAMAASLLLALLPFGLRVAQTPSDHSYTTLSATKPTINLAGDLHVVFAKSTSADDIERILSKFHAQQVGEANSVGAISIRLKTDEGSPDQQQALVQLRNSPDVLLAEPVLQP